MLRSRLATVRKAAADAMDCLLIFEKKTTAHNTPDVQNAQRMLDEAQVINCLPFFRGAWWP